ncbi:hypothetical protein ABZP36_012556 [Zizania latifolia]
MTGDGTVGGKGGAVAAVGPVSVVLRKLVQSLKGIMNGPEAEIYVALRDCGMDPDEAVSRLLSQDTLPFATMGSGSLAAMSVFESKYKEDLTDRRKIIKSLKRHIMKLVLGDYGWILLISILSVVDDIKVVTNVR